MRYQLYISTTLLCLLLFFSNGLKASSLVCNSCDTRLEALNYASQKLKPLGKFYGTFYVGNVKKEQYYAFSVRYESVYDDMGNDPVRKLVVRNSSVSSTTMNKFNELSNNGLYVLSRGKVDVPVDSGFDSAWGIAQVPANRDLFDQWFLDNHPIQYWTDSIISAFGGTIIGAVSGLEVTFIFSDQSEITFVAAKLTDTTLKFKFKPNSAEDKSNNTIPDAGSSIGGGFVFDSTESLENYINNAANYGIDIYFSSSSGGGVCGVNLVCNVNIVTSN